MSGQNRLINSTMQKASESALASALTNANEVAAKESKSKEKKEKKEK